MCEHAQCAQYMDLRYILYFYCVSEHFTSIPFYLVVYSIYMSACTIVNYLFASFTYRDNQDPIPYLVLIMQTTYACWFNFNINLTLYAQNNGNFFLNGSKIHCGFKLVYLTICHRYSELFKYFSGLWRIAQAEKPIGGEPLPWLPI